MSVHRCPWNVVTPKFSLLSLPGRRQEYPQGGGRVGPGKQEENQQQENQEQQATASHTKQQQRTTHDKQQ